MKKSFEPGLHFFSPEVLETIEINADIAWSDLINDIELGYEELKTFLNLGDECNLSMAEIAIMYLYYWENESQNEIAAKIKVDRSTISRVIEKIKRKIHAPLLKRLHRSQGVEE